MDDKQKSRKYFDSHSNTFLNRNGYWNHDYRLTIWILEKRNAKRLIDIGCGNGAFLEMFHKLSPGTKLAGLDLSREMVAEEPGETSGSRHHRGRRGEDALWGWSV